MAIIIFFFFSFILFVSQTSSSSHPDPPQTFIVHVSTSHKPTLFSTHHDWYTSIIHSLPPSPHPPSLLYSYKLAIRGFSAQLTPLHLHKLRQLPYIIAVMPDQIRQIHTTRTPHFLGLSNNFGIWQNSYHGQGVIIGVLDTGIWPERPSFSDSGLSPAPATWKGVCETSTDFPPSACNRKIIGARVFYKGYESYRRRPIDESKESKSPRDTEGHGTHTASTAAGSPVSNVSFFNYAYGEASGMASRAHIAAYKICWSAGCFDSDILAAMDQAVADGVHVISLSVGSSGYAPRYDHDSIAIGAFGAAEHGVVVSCSAGNSGPGPQTAVNIAPWILTVGASTIDREFPADVLLGNGKVFSGVSLYSGDPLPDSKLPLVYGGDCGSRYCYMGRLDSSKIQGKIVVCDRGGNARVEKGSAVKLAGGIGMILANTEDSGEELLADSHLIPATMVGQIAGDEIRAYTKSSQYPTATIMFRGTVIGTSPPSPRVASFSSRGPNHITREILKPDVIAPGVNILAGWTGASAPTDLDIDPRRVEFNIISGTSMSCPHVSGIAGLLKKAYPSWSPAAVKSALVTSAFIVDNSGRNITDLASGKESTSFIHGAGHVDPNRALNPGLVYDIDSSEYIWFLCSIGYNAKQISVFTREIVDSNICSSKRLGSPGDLNYPSFAVAFNPDTNVIKYKRTVKNVGGSVDSVFEVKVNAPENVDVVVSPSKLVFDAENQKLDYEISFSKLDWLGTKTSSFGWIEWSDGSHLVRSPIAVTWTREFEDSIISM